MIRFTLPLDTPPFVIQTHRLLFCDECGTWTRHENVGDYYICGCGTMVEYHINAAPTTYAIDLSEPERQAAEIEADLEWLQ
jgi:hypothetical protein